MSLFSIIAIIVVVWLVLKLKHFISGIQIASSKTAVYKKEKSRKTGMDIQDADYEDVE